MSVYIQNCRNGDVFETDSPEYWLESDHMTRLPYTKGKAIYREQCADTLRKMDIAKVYTVLRKVSPSGMQRQISLYTIQDDRPVNITYLVSRVLDWRTKGDYLVVNGCGMDMGFHTVYALSATLHGHDERGGYAISQEWM